MKHLYDSLRACAKEEEVKAPSTPCPLLKGDMLAAFYKQTDLLTPNGVRVPPAVSGVSREQIRL